MLDIGTLKAGATGKPLLQHQDHEGKPGMLTR